MAGNKNNTNTRGKTGMKLKAFIEALDSREFYGDEHFEISSITTDSRQASSRSLFVAVPGVKTDGHNFLKDAYAAGARAFVTQKSFRMSGVSNIIVPDSRTALAVLTAQLYGNPSRSLKLIGITGTNGKTTTAFLLESILREAGYTVGLISTIAYRFSSNTQDAERTTPDQIDLQRLLRDMADEGMQYVVMEVSSHGLKQRRVDGCHFDAGIFTNLTPEHLDYHVTMDDYFRSKERFFTEVLAGSSKKQVGAILNGDDEKGALLRSRTRCTALTYGLTSGDIYPANVRLTLDGISADIVTSQGLFPVASRLIGVFNLYNILAAVGAATFLDIPQDSIARGVEKMIGVPGRMERIENTRGISVFVDYAHTGDALENVLVTLTRLDARRIITMFGCGGDRDREKRPVMGATAARYSKVVLITSDNPRSENPDAIIRAIEEGVVSQGLTRVDENAAYAGQDKVYIVCPDRHQAIKKAIALAGPDDVVLLAGKGHETYQQTGSDKKHFDDREEARMALAAGA